MYSCWGTFKAFCKGKKDGEACFAGGVKCEGHWLYIKPVCNARVAVRACSLCPCPGYARVWRPPVAMWMWCVTVDADDGVLPGVCAHAPWPIVYGVWGASSLCDDVHDCGALCRECVYGVCACVPPLPRHGAWLRHTDKLCTPGPMGSVAPMPPACLQVSTKSPSRTGTDAHFMDELFVCFDHCAFSVGGSS